MKQEDSTNFITETLTKTLEGGVRKMNQNSEPVPLDINKIPELLANTTCSDFVTRLINTAAQLNPTNPPNSSNALDLFDAIKNGTGGYVLGVISFAGSPAGGGVSGTIINRDAKVFISPMIWPVPVPDADMIRISQHVYALAGLHETIHHAGHDTYTDAQLARAAHDMTGIETNFPPAGTINPFAWSRYWDDILKANCPR
jgi:hypothetical protein